MCLLRFLIRTERNLVAHWILVTMQVHLTLLPEHGNQHRVLVGELPMFDLLYQGMETGEELFL